MIRVALGKESQPGKEMGASATKGIGVKIPPTRPLLMVCFEYSLPSFRRVYARF